MSKLFVSEGMSHENPKLPYRCRQLKTAGKIHFGKVSHIVDIENLLEIDNFDEFVNNTFLTYLFIYVCVVFNYNIVVAKIIL